MKKVLILVCFLIMLSGIGIASAETITGTLGDDAFVQQVSYTMPDTGSGTTLTFLKANVKTIESLKGLSVVIHFDSDGQYPSFNAGAPVGIGNIPFVAKIGAVEIGNGTMGYQRNFASGIETSGYQWLIFDNWTGSDDYSGNQKVLIEYNSTLMYNIARGSIHLAEAPAEPSFCWGGTTAAGYEAFGMEGILLLNLKDSVLNDYEITKPASIGVSGKIVKSSDGITYPSRAYLLNASGYVLSSESSSSSNEFNFSAPTGNGFILAIRSPNMATWYNTSVLFPAAAGPTPTPTPTITPIGPDNPIPAGYIRTMAQCVDGQTSGSIHDCQLDLYDIENTSWSNGSYLDMGSYYGTWWIDTLPGHTINAYASSTGYTPVSRLNLPASSTYMYELILWPTSIPAAGSGFVNLYVLVHDADSGNAITGASVQVRILDGTTYAQTTGTSGSRMFEVPNSSYTSITVSKYGYVTATRGITTSASGDDTVRIELLKKVVTTVPTSTIPPGGVTTAVTVDPNDPAITGSTNAKGQEMLNWLAMNGMDLVQLCFLVTMLALLGVKLGK